MVGTICPLQAGPNHELRKSQNWLLLSERQQALSTSLEGSQNIDNIICLPGELIGCEYLRSEPWKEGGFFMSTYEELQIILTFALLIVAILNLKNKK